MFNMDSSFRRCKVCANFRGILPIFIKISVRPTYAGVHCPYRYVGAYAVLVIFHLTKNSYYYDMGHSKWRAADCGN